MVVNLLPANGAIAIELTQDKADLYVDAFAMAGLKQLVEKIRAGQVEILASEEQEVTQNPQGVRSYYKVVIVPKA